MRIFLAVLLTAAVVGLGTPASAGRCSTADVKEMIRGYVDAYNKGSVKALDELFLKGDNFRSYDVHPVERIDGDDRSTLMRYFRERRSFGDSIQGVERLRAGRYDNGNAGFGFSLEFHRSSDEISPFASGFFVVKGSATCKGIYFWNMTWNGP